MLGGNTPPTIKDLTIPFNNIVAVAIGFAGIGFFVMLLIGGFKFITSGGDPKAAGAAKQTLTYAIGGFIFIASAYLILQIISNFTGVSRIIVFNTCFGNRC